MPVHSIKNQYRGINAHLHSYYQAEGEWGGFHTPHIADLCKALLIPLEPMGYIAEVERSLQIRGPRADIGIYDLEPERSLSTPITSQPTSHAAQLSAIAVVSPDDFDDDDPYRAIAIYPSEFRREDDLVAWIELLSPTNKIRGEKSDIYRQKRLSLLKRGIVFVEIDYLNETYSMLYNIGALNEFAYRIAVIDPRPDLGEGNAFVEGFGVDDPIPAMTIPLSNADTLRFDFSEVYQKTFAEMHYGRRFVDYRELPLHFNRYSHSDQARIVNRMIAVLEVVRRGDDLHKGIPFPVEDLPLEQALRRWEKLK